MHEWGQGHRLPLVHAFAHVEEPRLISHGLHSVLVSHDRYIY